MVTERARVLTIDLGGSGLRLGLAGSDGSVQLLGRCCLHMHYPNAYSGAVEFDSGFAQEVRRAVTQAVGALSDTERKSIAAVVATSMREGFVLLDEGGDVVYAGPNGDYRALDEAVELEALIGKRVYEATGQWLRPPVGSIHAPCRLLWLERRQPERLEKASTFMMLSDWIASLFTGELACEPTCASSSALLNISSLEWEHDLIDFIGVQRGMFPQILPVGSVIGKVNMAAGGLARDCGLDAHTVVVAGGADTQHSLLGCGILGVGSAAIVAGTTSPVQMVIDRPMVDPMANTWTSCHVKPGTWVLESNAGRTGFAYSWFADLLRELSPGSDMEGIYRRIDELADQSSPGSGGVTFVLDPAVMGEPSGGANYRGLIHGIKTTGEGRTTAADFARALMENMASAYALNLAQLERVWGRRIEQVTVSGGSTGSRVQLRVIAEAMNRTLYAARAEETTMLGAAMSAFTACGVYGSIDEAARAMRSETVEIPIATPVDSQNGSVYAEVRRRWQALRRAATQLSSGA